MDYSERERGYGMRWQTILFWVWVIFIIFSMFPYVTNWIDFTQSVIFRYLIFILPVQYLLKPHRKNPPEQT